MLIEYLTIKMMAANQDEQIKQEDIDLLIESLHETVKDNGFAAVIDYKKHEAGE